MKKYKYNYVNEFRGSIRGVNKYFTSGDILNPEDVAYFKHHYPERIILLDSTETEETKNNVVSNEPNIDIVKLLADQSEKINELINVVKNTRTNTNIVYTNLKDSPINSSGIEIQETSIVDVLNVGDSNIESQGTVGEVKTQGISVSDKVNKLRKVIRNKK